MTMKKSHSQVAPATPISRRGFVKGAAMATFTIVPRRVLGGPGHVPPSERVNLGMIGVGGQGTSDMTEFLPLKQARVVAVCDVRRTCDYSKFYYGGVKGWEPAQRLVNEAYAEDRKAGGYSGCAVFTDFHEMLDRADVDAVYVGTPDHMHAIPTMAAIRKKKHVYCQKPLTYTVREARAVAEAAKEHGVVTQMGNQVHASDKLKRLVEMLKGGAIGRVREIHCWADATYGGLTRPADTPPVPEGFDWDHWLGPAPYRPYHPDYAPFSWRNWRDFGTGNLGDFGCHILDPAMWAIGFPKQMTINATSSALSDESWSVKNTVHYSFTAPELGEPVRVTWYDGGLQPPRPAELEAGRELPSAGGMYVGDAGIIVAQHSGEARLVPESKMAAYQAPAPTLPRGESHWEEFVRACRGGAAPLSNFSYAGPLTEMVLLGLVAIETGKSLEWDSEKFAITNLPDAKGLLHREYRAGWTL
jgi:predicted dehydrogenase